jgi:hypothetical protein
MYIVASPYDSFFHYANRLVPPYANSWAAPPVAPLNPIARDRRPFPAAPALRQQAGIRNETLAAQIEAEMTGKGRWFNEYI